MGEIADMMLDGTMDSETGEWNFGGADGPGWPMTGAEAAAYRHSERRHGREARRDRCAGPTAFEVSAKLRAKIEVFGELRQNDPYHWQVRKDRRVVADWWPHKSKWRIADKLARGNEHAFIIALTKAVTQ